MNVRERLEQQEYLLLAPWASHAAESRGRSVPDDPCDLRTVFQRDRDRIIHCKSFRRLKFKTQVFLSPEGDHYRTRLTHTLEVAQVARTIARSLRLNEDLAEAIALGHDLGHTPYGHIGERTLDSLLPEGFRHALTWKAGITSVKMIPGGRGISYGHRYHTTGTEQRVGVIPVGYADGYRRVQGNKVLVHGKIVPVIGNVCMDQCMIDLNDLPEANIGDEAVLIGQQGDQMISVEEVAASWGTINYEVTCGIAHRVNRFYS